MHVCVGSPAIARGENHINSRLQIKQYLWAIVIKGKFNSVLMPHYVWLCEAQLGLAASSVGPEVTREGEHQPARCALAWLPVLSMGHKGEAFFLHPSSPEGLSPSLSPLVLLWPHRSLQKL